MEFACVDNTEFARQAILGRSAQPFGNARWVKTRERKMRSEIVGFAWNPQFLHAHIDFTCERSKIRCGVDACPQHARALLVREKAEPTKTQLDDTSGTHFRERSADRVQLSGLDLSDKFQRHVQILRAHPARSVF